MYLQNPQDHLDRAKTLLRSGDKALWFYAALELRFATEAQFRSTLETIPNVSKKHLNQYQISKLASTIERAYGNSSVGVLVAIIYAGSERIAARWLHMPVSPTLQALASRLGDYLHSSYGQFLEDVSYWERFRSVLDGVVDELEKSLAGNMYGKPLLNSRTGAFTVVTDLSPEMLKLAESMKEEVLLISVDYVRIKASTEGRQVVLLESVDE